MTSPTNDLSDVFAAIESIQADMRKRAIQTEQIAANNRARMRRWSPEFAGMIEQLRERGMFGRVVRMEVPE